MSVALGSPVVHDDGVKSSAEAAGEARPRRRRDRHDIRDQLIESAIAEFGARGFDGASTRAIAARVHAHQPQIHYYFETNDQLWRACVEHLFARQLEAMEGIEEAGSQAAIFAERIRRLVRFSARHPELNQIILHEATWPSDRTAWLTDTYLRPRFEGVEREWEQLKANGVAVPVSSDVIYHALLGAVALRYVTAAETRALLGDAALEPAGVEAHAEEVVTLFLPGLASQ